MQGGKKSFCLLPTQMPRPVTGSCSREAACMCASELRHRPEGLQAAEGQDEDASAEIHLVSCS